MIIILFLYIYVYIYTYIYLFDLVDRPESTLQFLHLKIGYMIIPYNDSSSKINSGEDRVYDHATLKSLNVYQDNSMILKAIKRFHSNCNNNNNYCNKNSNDNKIKNTNKNNYKNNNNNNNADENNIEHTTNNTCYSSSFSKNCDDDHAGKFNNASSKPFKSGNINRFQRSTENTSHPTCDRNNLFDELHSICTAESFLHNSEEDKEFLLVNTARTHTYNPHGMFRKKEGRISPRIFIEFLRHRVSSYWVERVEELVEKLKEGSFHADVTKNILCNTSSQLEVMTIKNPKEEEEHLDIMRNILAEGYAVDRNRSVILDLDEESKKILDLLRDGAEVRSMNMLTAGGD